MTSALDLRKIYMFNHLSDERLAEEDEQADQPDEGHLRVHVHQRVRDVADQGERFADRPQADGDGDGTPTAAVDQGDGDYTTTVVAPVGPSSDVVQALVDGVVVSSVTIA